MVRPSNVNEQPLIGIFSLDTSALLYALPSDISGGPIYIYTNIDDGNRPDVQRRIKLELLNTNDAPDDTLVNYMLFGTLTVSQAAFILDFAGYSTGGKGCTASFQFEFPQTTSTPTLFPAPSASPTITFNPALPPSQQIINAPTDLLVNPIIPIYDPLFDYPLVPFPGQYPEMKLGPKGKSPKGKDKKGKSKGKKGKSKRRNFRT